MNEVHMVAEIGGNVAAWELSRLRIQATRLPRWHDLVPDSKPMGHDHVLEVNRALKNPSHWRQVDELMN